jgi:Kdo2-lipid IVA lauroyltransferase/acyltransferase
MHPSPAAAPPELPAPLPVRRMPRKWVAHGLSNAVVYGGLLHGAVRLPLPLLRGISFVGNSIALALMRRTPKEMAQNFRQALGVGPTEARRLARRTFYEYGRTTVDLWRCRSGIAEMVPRLTTFDADGAALKRLCRNGRGFLLVTGHVGNWEMGAVALRGHQIPAAVLGQPEIDPRVHAMRRRIRERLGVASIDIGSQVATALQVRAAIVRGVVVAMAADRAYEEDRVFVPFFGRPTPFLRSPAMLARFCSCALVPSFFLRNRDGSYRGVLGEPLEPRHEISPDEDAVRMMGAVASALERTVREEPTQWFNFFRYWK